MFKKVFSGCLGAVIAAFVGLFGLFVLALLIAPFFA